MFALWWKQAPKRERVFFYPEGQNAVVCAGLEIKFTLPSTDKMWGDNLWKAQAQLYVVFLVLVFFLTVLIKNTLLPTSSSLYFSPIL